MIDSRGAVTEPRTIRFGLGSHEASARRMNASSRRWMYSAPTASLSWKTSPARIDSMIAGVPPSSRWAGSAR